MHCIRRTQPDRRRCSGYCHNHLAVLGGGGADRKAQDALWATTLPALPARNPPTVTTARCAGTTLRDTMLWITMTTDEPATTGSMVSSGCRRDRPCRRSRPPICRPPTSCHRRGSRTCLPRGQECCACRTRHRRVTVQPAIEGGQACNPLQVRVSWCSPAPRKRRLLCLA